MNTDLKNYLVVTAGYWAFTLTDGAIRMLVVLYFHMLGYSPFEVAMLFLFYEFFGIVTNLVGGWMAARLGLNVTMHLGMAMQVVALLMLTVPDAWLSVAYVMAAQALSGIAKDLNKMSAKASVKTLVSSGTDTNSKLFKWVAILTGSKNALKGVGFFLGALLLEIAGFRVALAILAGGLFIILIITWIMLPNEIGKAKAKPKFTQVFSNIAAINWLSAARFFLFGSRDVWFVVALPVFFYEVLHWDFMKIGGFMALWVIGYGIVQASAPMILKGHHPTGRTALWLALILASIPAAIALAMSSSFSPSSADNLSNVTWIVVIGLLVFGVAFAINSAVHSYLILAYSDNDKVSMNVGFYYMANAGGRLAGTVLSGLVYQSYGLVGCLWISAAFILMAAILSLGLPAQAELE
ncbi:organoarsenical effux MFS transporter ArsJ [Cocleimonas sp. KMM 6892]|uniref:organoarsenical effux MFS transporter ArsJ n=1 Tax=unclassified Cocleimonas TaxID=2639732 RepID=UPI002DBB5BA2|nr:MULTISPECIES: organoarsenical effux MFS transporter ArsJ [unclassified Cocleimonas]MEB8431004.1 organoarsenical effux MFS transporter ArsJ [Cocleimonas sp. KMM 6892]MEC4714224.1 organoarsenical effux MFS transporter ArsJ [Cocleimonas sp. KMM 6895]MEC4743555.1 organoarsenical effux MFS transporter ArsJ [Cocleimonas sp. KMM 6896]